jgi:hypothetical protein
MGNQELLARIEKLEAKNRELEATSTKAADIVEIQQVQARYMYYLETSNFDRIWNELFANKDPRVKCELVDSGVYEGPESCKRLWMALSKMETEQQPRPGVFPMLFIATPLVVVSKDGKTAKAQWHVFGPHAMYVTPYPGDEKKLTAYWFGGKYDNEFVKEDGKWKLLSLHAIAWIRSPIDQGWLKQPDCRRLPTPPGAFPDKPTTKVTIYHPDALYMKNGVYNWGPPPPEEEC